MKTWIAKTAAVVALLLIIFFSLYGKNIEEEKQVVTKSCSHAYNSSQKNLIREETFFKNQEVNQNEQKNQNLYDTIRAF